MHTGSTGHGSADYCYERRTGELLILYGHCIRTGTVQYTRIKQ